MPGGKKNSTQASRKAAAQAKKGPKDLTPLGQKLPSIPGRAGDKTSNRMAKDASNLVAAGQIAAMSPATIMRQFIDQTNASTSPAYLIARTLVAKLMLSLPNAASNTDSLTSWSPTGALMYLVWALFDSCRRAGVFQNAAMVNAFPPFPAEGFIPVAWAQYLSYLKPFRGALVSAQYTDSTFSALPTAPTNNAVGLNGNSFALGNGDFSAHPFATGSGLENTLSLGAGTTWASLWTYAPYLSTVWASGLSCVRFDAVPAHAPDASAYVQRLGVASGTYGLACFTPKFNPEIGFIFYPTNTIITSTLSYYKPVPVLSGNHSYEFWWVENFQLCSFIPGANLKKTLKTHLWNQADFAGKASKFKRVRVKGKVSGKRTQPVRFLLGNSIVLDTRVYQSMIGYVAALYGYAALDKDRLGVFALVAMSALIAKVLPYCYASNQVGAVPTATYDPRFKNAELPVSIVAVLNTIGPVAAAGRMHCPTLFNQNGIDLRGGWLRFSTVGNLSNVEILWNLIFGGANTVTNVTVGTYVFSAANFATTTNYGATPVCATDQLLSFFASVFGGAIGAGGGQSLNLVKPDGHNPIGKANMLVYGEIVTSQSANVTTIISGVTTVSQLVKAIGSFYHIAGDELGVAISCPLAAPVDQNCTLCTVNQTGAPFRAAMVSGNMTSYLASYIQETTTAQVSEAIAQCLALNRRRTVELGGVTIDVSQNGDFFGAIVDTIVGPIFGDTAADILKSSPLGVLGRAATETFANPLGLLDEIGVTDGLVSSFGLDNPDLAKLLPMAMAAVAL